MTCLYDQGLSAKYSRSESIIYGYFPFALLESLLVVAIVDQEGYSHSLGYPDV